CAKEDFNYKKRFDVW
nr:immunoglobulin heavy chain junction region [Macaca mulatta]MOV38653.1 immunoglobulin heavy chain junction region [Macaca mulatta]MOV39452.1 immunoglobulin heavy chain junction region [Macaca mulatta]MOV40845.1 immunoglobulin heavy chain junction region [Macaca mulatta]MOV41212.1 immunoglobulin heavy chain junction region [Macaca mulatta]